MFQSFYMICLFFIVVCQSHLFSDFNVTRLIRAAVPNLPSRPNLPNANPAQPHGNPPQLHNGHQTKLNSNRITFFCPFSQVLLIHEFSINEVKMACGTMNICNEQRSCAMVPNGGLCTGKANYLAGIKETVHDGEVTGYGCQYTPPVSGHVNDNCQTFTIVDNGPNKPMTYSTLMPHRHVPGQPINGAGSAGAGVPVAGAGEKHVHMSFFRPAPHPPPVQVVKGIQKTPTGYTVTYCTVQCDKTTTTKQPTTVKSPNQPPPPPVPVVPAGGQGSSGGSTDGGSHGGSSSGGSSNDGSSHGGSSNGGDSHASSSHGGSSHESSSHNSGSSHGQSRIVVHHSSSNSNSASSSSSNSASSLNSASHSNSASSQNAQSHSSGDGSHEVHHAHHGHGSGSGGGGGWGGCFSSEMTTQTKFGLKRMDELQIGDEVLVARSDQIESYQPIEWFYHQNKETETTFVTIRTESNRTLSLTPNHLLPFVPCYPKRTELSDLEEYINYDSLFSEKAKPGMCLATKMGNHFETDLIQSVVHDRKKGVFSPITTQGTIIVNDIQASCYSTVEHHYLQYGMHKSLLHIRRLLDPLWKLFSSSSAKNVDQNEVPFVLRFIGEITELVMPSLMFK